MKPKIFIDGEHGTTGLQIRTRLAARDDLDVLSIPEAERRNLDIRAELLQGSRYRHPLPAGRRFEGSRRHARWPELDAHHRHFDRASRASGLGIRLRGNGRRSAYEDRRSSRLVANPGCYPTGAISLIRPLVTAGILPADYPVTRQCRLRLYRRRQADDRADGGPSNPEDHIAAPAFPLRPVPHAQARCRDEAARPARPAADLRSVRRPLCARHDRAGAAVISPISTVRPRIGEIHARPRRALRGSGHRRSRAAGRRAPSSRASIRPSLPALTDEALRLRHGGPGPGQSGGVCSTISARAHRALRFRTWT